jgi:hypothetical protein
VKKLLKIIPFRNSLKKYLFTRYFFVLPEKEMINTTQTELFCLLCHEHTAMFIHSVKSFYDSTKYILPIIAIDDGSLTSQDKNLLQENLNITILKKEQVLKKILPLIKNYPFLTKYFQDKKTSIKKLKLTFLLLPSERKILTESDILFLKPISEIISWIQRKKKNKIHLILDRFATDQLTSMAMVDLNFRKLIVKILQPKANYLFNGGLLFLPGVISKKELGVLEKSCKLFYEIGYIYNPYCEELLLSLLTNTDKDTALDPRLHATVWSYQHYRTINNPALIHYASDTKNILESDVVKQKLKKIFRIS